MSCFTETVLVRIKQLSKTFGTFPALRDVDLEIEPGIVFGLLGPNGAGKTTLLRLLLGFLFPSGGTAQIAGLNCHTQSVAVHRNLSYLPGDAQLFGSLKGRKVLKFFSNLRTDCSFQQALELADRLQLDLSRRVAFMSTGMRQKLALCVCLSTTAELTILDEPTANLDPTVRGEVIKMISEIKKQGRTVIFSSHVLSEIEDVCDRVVIMKSGEIVKDLDMAELKSRHFILATCHKSKLQVPQDLQKLIQIQYFNGHCRIDALGDLKPILSWLEKQPISKVRIEGIGLHTIYHECHNTAESTRKQLSENVS
ncbi:MAG: ABC transporter ATP-binding protein [Planctomycetota bacterium]|nr:ABC transporter ATP-binding protein [Planctomycetota bacterium]